MTRPTAVLLPKVFPSDLVSLGQLVRNPLAPNINCHTNSCSKVTEADICKPDIESPYNSIVSIDTRGRFEIGLVKYLGLNLNARSTNLLSIEADKLEYTALKDSSAAFKRICDDDEAKEWIGEMLLNKSPCYLVVGIQELHNAKFKRAVLTSGAGTGLVTVPLQETVQIPLHIKGEVAADGFGNSGAIVNGIFGIQVQKLRSRIVPSGQPGLKSEASWYWSYQRVKGTQQEEKEELHVELGDVELSELIDLLKQDDDDDDDDEEEEE